MVGVVVVGISGVGSRNCVEGRRHEAENHVQGDSAKDSHAVDVAVKDLSREKKEGTVQDDVEQGSVEITIIHKVVVDRSKGIENSQSLDIHVSLNYKVRAETRAQDPSLP